MKQEGRHRDEWKLTSDINTGFTVPENYFSDIESNVIMRLKEDKLPKNHGFITPKKYFEKLDNHIIEKTKTKKGKLITFNKIKFISVAASIVLLLFFGSNFISNTNTELTSEEIISWLDTNINSIPNDELAFALAELNTNNINPYLVIKNDDIVESLLNSNDMDFLIEDINTK